MAAGERKRGEDRGRGRGVRGENRRRGREVRCWGEEKSWERGELRGRGRGEICRNSKGRGEK